MTKEQLIEFIQKFPNGSEIVGSIEVDDEWYNCESQRVRAWHGFKEGLGTERWIEFGGIRSNAFITYKII